MNHSDMLHLSTFIFIHFFMQICLKFHSNARLFCDFRKFVFSLHTGLSKPVWTMIINAPHCAEFGSSFSLLVNQYFVINLFLS
jgi:hypothetical protein